MIAWLYDAAGTKLRKTTFSSILELHDDPIAPGAYQADAIVSGGRVATGSNVTFTAATGITLQAGFSVEAGAEFLAEIAQPAGLPRDYVGGIEYYNGIMEAIYHAEGRVSFDNGQSLYEYNLTDHLGNLRLSFADRNGDGDVDITSDPATNEILQEHHYYPFGMALEGDWVNNPVKGNRYRYNGKELEEDFGLEWYDYGARWYDAAIGRFPSVDPLAEQRSWVSPYNYVQNNPLSRIDPDGALDYPIIRITKQKTGQTADQRVLGYSGGTTTQVDLYKVVVTDTEDANFRMEFSITRDAWTVENPGSNTASNVAFEPKDGNVNHFTGKVMPNGYPQGNGTEALKLTQHNSEVVHAEPNQTSVNMGYRNKADVAAGVMIHVGGNYEKNGKNRVAASEGCFGICNPGNSSSNQSNTYSNNILNTIQQQADKSQTNPGHIRVILEKREGNEYPTTKKIN